MSSASYFISPHELWSRIGTADAPTILDVCRREIYEAGPGVIPTAQWRKPETYLEWVPGLPADRPIVLACRYGHNLSQMMRRSCAGAACPRRCWKAAARPGARPACRWSTKATLERFAPKSPSLWVTRRRPKIDRVACPWLIRRFIDPQARILYVDPPEVKNIAADIGAIPFDIEGVEISHEGERCSFDTMLKLFGLEGDPHLARVALIVRGADTARPRSRAGSRRPARDLARPLGACRRRRSRHDRARLHGL